MSTRFEGLVKILKLMFRQDFVAEVWSLFSSWCLWFWSLILVEILKLGLVKIFKFKFFSKCWCLVEILKLVLDRLCKNLWYDLKKLLWWAKLNPRVRCAFGNVFLFQPFFDCIYGHSFSHRSNEDWSVILCCICADLFTGSSDYEERPPSLSFRSSSGRFVCRRIGQICRTICFNQALQMRHEVVVFRSFSQQL